MTPTTSAVSALALHGITKSYGSVTACDAVDLTVEAGEVHGLLGENGAGKSSLMKVLLGLVQRDAGTVLVRGQEVALDNPQHAAALGTRHGAPSTSANEAANLCRLVHIQRPPQSTG